MTALLLGGVLMLLPFAWMFSTSWRLAKDSFSLPPQWWPTTWHVANYREVLENIPFVAFVVNSLQVTVLITLGQLVTCSMAAYAFARLRFPGREALFLVFLSAADGAAAGDHHSRLHPDPRSSAFSTRPGRSSSPPCSARSAPSSSGSSS